MDLRAEVLVVAAVTVSCSGASPATPPSSGDRGGAAAEPFEPAPGAMPTAEQLEGAPGCVRDLAEYRACWLDAFRAPRSSFSCPFGGELAVIHPGQTIPHDLHRAWASRVYPCTVSLEEPATEETEPLFVDAGMEVSEARGQFVYGAIPLSHLLCVARIDGIRSIECEPPPDVIQ